MMVYKFFKGLIGIFILLFELTSDIFSFASTADNSIADVHIGRVIIKFFFVEEFHIHI